MKMTVKQEVLRDLSCGYGLFHQIEEGGKIYDKKSRRKKANKMKHPVKNKYLKFFIASLAVAVASIGLVLYFISKLIQAFAYILMLERESAKDIMNDFWSIENIS